MLNIKNTSVLFTEESLLLKSIFKQRYLIVNDKYVRNRKLEKENKIKLHLMRLASYEVSLSFVRLKCERCYGVRFPTTTKLHLNLFLCANPSLNLNPKP